MASKCFMKHPLNKSSLKTNVKRNEFLNYLTNKTLTNQESNLCKQNTRN